ncbi:CDP-diacylglycerol--glycerol-3-phosphate 3-phosphatidyltransferase [Acholeplasma laidlawii]|uniref:CDP-diacylglycerol--glycerol-3-phosphate 3-phosphatidyltransferase n=2 Tax=Acholeplasma laidlawii TaxID=2148 RepID=A9NGM4_ACHLI|nr:CDP-diacylglycerol--glycerol-3-phosphate 3-phosphatidyltransferase [Acholeplasma laidlawii]ABX81504.1 CDP-diacylglycerol-glycerol-3-phosphate 3-phosphatidyltransferase [Acholeplasma laidlawii PG-8A]NWH09923.1 CDP-diacylglycerol--glycerol-3-phosphate 3-phosphatidyltransferase [Acholeplasma laidlawii]NWH11313.1 CDP-diacylglycerol--glycerol-3-phosphate 3-phosphatidyltransferase [Acholeplasma laidlawii]NWH13277.1 CDP-diacylglycerol--glycerol-3-phosphate 3-phosphatidyltransferase [Acholeplasma la
MTTANKLTILRILLIPVMITVLYIDALVIDTAFLNMTVQQIIFAGLFILASLTDFLDGYIARKYNQITTFGKFLDPIADKVLVFTALLYLMVQMPDRVAIWGVMVIIVREFLVTGVRLIAVEHGKVIAASHLGKYKTLTTMLAIIMFLFNDFGLTLIHPNLVWVTNIVYYIAIFFTVWSGFDYLYKNREIILESV